MAIIIQGSAFVSATTNSGAGSGGGSLAIENCKGRIHVFSDTGDGGRTSGFYQVEPAIPETEDSKALIMGIPIAFQEIVQPTVTLDEQRTLYVFGSAWNDVSISGLLLLGGASTKGAQLGKLIQWYNTNRVSRSKKPIRVSLGTTGINAYVVGLSLAEANPRTNTQVFSIRALTSEIQS